MHKSALVLTQGKAVAPKLDYASGVWQRMQKEAKGHAWAKNTILSHRYEKDAEVLAARFLTPKLFLAASSWFSSTAYQATTRLQGGRRADCRFHSRRRPLYRASTAVLRSSITKPSRSRLPLTINKKPTATGTPSLVTAARRASAAGAKTSGRLLANHAACADRGSGCRRR